MLLSVFVTSVFDLVCKVSNIGDLSSGVDPVPSDVAHPVQNSVLRPDLQPRRVAPVPSNIEATTDDIVLARNSQLDCNEAFYLWCSVFNQNRICGCIATCEWCFV